MTETLRIGELTVNNAQICQALNCKLFNTKPYQLCQVKTSIKTEGIQTRAAKPRVISNYRSAIPKGCALKYYIAHPAGESINTYRGRDDGTW